MVIILLENQLRRIHMVHPVRHISGIVIVMLAGNRVHQHGPVNICAAEQADGLAHPGANPEGVAVLVDFKGRLVKHIGGVLETQEALQIAPKMLRRGIADALVQTHHLYILVDHVDDQVGRQAVGAVIQPLDPVAVAQTGNPHGAALIVDLGIVVIHLKLGNHVCQLAQLAVAQSGGGIPVQHGNLVVRNFLHLAGEVTVGDRQQVPIAGGPDHLPAQHCAHQRHHNQRCRRKNGDGALLFDKLRIALDPCTLKAGGENGHAAVTQAQQQSKGIEIRAMQVDGRQHHIIVDKAHNQSHRQIDERPAQGSANGLALLFRLGRALAEGPVLTGKALEIGIVPVCIHGLPSLSFHSFRLILHYCT